MSPKYFASAAEFRRWLKANHATATELLVGFHKRATGRPSLTWPESVDEALCFGWIDGVRKRVDDDRYTIRFSRRRPTSVWSAINIKKAKELIKRKRMAPAGLAAFEARDEKRSAVYSYENRPKALDAATATAFRRDPAAWAFYQAQPPWYRRIVVWYLMEAKKAETRARRLARVIAAHAAGKRL
jgi:uncharacterized protein YdeI (YjbR/CyaY-like superfamily)